MARPVTLFTGQWADMPLEDLARKASEFGYSGLELACWGDHFDVTKALEDSSYCAAKRDLLERHELSVHAISNHLVGQAVCDTIDERHKSILPPHVWGDGKPAGVNARATEEMKRTARAAQKLGVKLPAWVSRHSGKGSIVVSQGATRFRITVANEVTFIGNVKDLDRRIQAAIDYQGNAMRRQAEYLLKKNIRKAGW